MSDFDINILDVDGVLSASYVLPAAIATATSATASYVDVYDIGDSLTQTGASPIKEKHIQIEDFYLDAVDTAGPQEGVTALGGGNFSVTVPGNYHMNSASGSVTVIFPTASGQWQSTDNWRKRGFYAACFEAGLVKKVEVDGKVVEKPKYKPYDLRHFYASMLIEQRCNLKRIQKLMGHEDIQTTLNVYGHIVEKAESGGHEYFGLLETIG